MVISRSGSEATLNLNNQQIEKVDRFKYLGLNVCVSEDGKMNQEINAAGKTLRAFTPNSLGNERFPRKQK